MKSKQVQNLARNKPKEYKFALSLQKFDIKKRQEECVDNQ